MALAPSLDGNDYPDEMYQQLGALCMRRFYSARQEGMTEAEAFEELVRVLLRGFIYLTPTGIKGIT